VLTPQAQARRQVLWSAVSPNSAFLRLVEASARYGISLLLSGIQLAIRQTPRVTLTVLNLFLGSILSVWAATRSTWDFLRPTLNVLSIIGSTVGVVYLIYDSIYQTGATISSVASDPKHPFAYPFVITNNSNIFAIRNLEWTCDIVHGGIPDNNFYAQNLSVSHDTQGQVHIIEPGNVLNVSCSQEFGNMPGNSIITVKIGTYYETTILWIYTFPRCPRQVFTWATWASNPQWVRGDYADDMVTPMTDWRGVDCRPVRERFKNMLPARS
jgi:hypothetical protein